MSRKGSRAGRYLEHKFDEHLRELRRLSLEKKRFRRNIFTFYNWLQPGGGQSLLLVTAKRTRENGLNLCQGGLGWILGKTSSPKGCQGTGTGKVVESSSLEASARVDVAPGDMV